MTKVSVIIPVYNVEDYLSMCIESVLKQTIKDIEIICINDGSTDSSAKILEDYATKDTRIKVITQENKGQAAARNKGLDTATGDYIMFLDSDDALSPVALETFYNIAQQTKLEIIICDKYTSDKGKLAKELHTDYKLFNNPVKDMLTMSMGNSSACNKLYKANLLENKRFIEGIYFEDWPFITMLFGEIQSYALVESVLYYYNQDNVSTMRSSFSAKKINDYVVGINHVYNYYKNSINIKYAKQRILKAIKMCVNQAYKDKKQRKILAPTLIAELKSLAKDKILAWHKLPFKVLVRILKMFIFNKQEIKLQKIFIQIICLFLPSKKLKKYVRTFFQSGGFSLFFPTKQKHLFYYKEGHNFGDILNQDLMRFFNQPFSFADSAFSQMVCIGSLLQVYLKDKNKITSKKAVQVFGSGFIKPRNQISESFCRPMKFYALRGKLSKKRCEQITGENLSNLPLGDPGLLISKIFHDIKPNPIIDVGIVCHLVDKNSDLLSSIQFKNLTYKFLDISQNPKDFINSLVECKFILSSAMHGLICADSFGIPNKHIVLSDKVIGGEYKFKDYYSVFEDFQYSPIYLQNNIICDDDIEKFKSEYTITQEQVNKICYQLIKAFPKKEEK